MLACWSSQAAYAPVVHCLQSLGKSLRNLTVLALHVLPPTTAELTTAAVVRRP